MDRIFSFENHEIGKEQETIFFKTTQRSLWYFSEGAEGSERVRTSDGDVVVIGDEALRNGNSDVFGDVINGYKKWQDTNNFTLWDIDLIWDRRGVVVSF